MSNEWSHGIERARESDAHVAASLTSDLIARATHPCGTSAMQEAENAVNLYRCVLAALAAGPGDQREKSTTPTMDSAAMQHLDVSRVGVKYRYKTFLYDKLDDALAYARLDPSHRCHRLLSGCACMSPLLAESGHAVLSTQSGLMGNARIECSKSRPAHESRHIV